MGMLYGPIADELQIAIDAVLKAYDLALLDPQTRIQSNFHAALLLLKKATENK